MTGTVGKASGCGVTGTVGKAFGWGVTVGKAYVSMG